MAATNSEAQDEEITQQYEDSTWQNEDSTQQNEDTKLTIESMSEIERKQHEKMSKKDRHKPSTFAVVIKWLFTIIFGILLLACLTVSKTSMLALSAAMGRNHPDLDINSRCRLFVKLQILTLVPNIINLLKSLWAGAFRKDFPMPSGKTILCAIPISLIESVGMCLFIFKIPSITKTNYNVLLMNCVFIVPLCDNIIRSCRKRTETNEFRWTVTFGIALLLEAIGIGFSIYLVSSDSDKSPKSPIWMPIVGIFALSFAWTPSVHRYLLESEITQSEPPYVNKKDGYSHANQNNSRNDKWKPGFLNPNGINKERVTWKLTIIMSALKIVSTFGTSMLIFNVEYISPFPVNSSVSIGDYSNGWTFWDDSSHQELYYFGVHICSSLISYYTGYIACSTCMQIGAFALPLVSTMILSLVLLTVPETCGALLLNTNKCCTQSSSDEQVVLIVAGSCLLIAQVMFSLRQIWENGSLIKLKAEQLFWLPVYTPTLLEQWLMLIRRSEFGDKEYHKRVIKTNRAKVIICTTMYREDAHEMKQLLESIRSVVQTKKEKHFESHIIFDDAVKCNEPTEYALQLLYLVEDVLGVRVNNAECTKSETPYGKSLKWTLYKDNVKNDENKMDLTIHLKDNTKVKNKKRWSQVMYMSYVLDVLLKELKATDEDVFILTTDADVKFTPDSIAYLLDLMARDDKVGAVCARTFPLGNGPIVWYQAFEYAIGHWFQKAAEHVIGSVLCSPGCFSVYRCKAIREILPAYASDVEHAFDFLTKDMGEDRWLCTLMVQTGRTIEYCAASENSTHCPESYDEFFKQRRRWVVSTIANLLLLLQEWNKVHEFNHRVSFVFLVYQAVLLFATLVGPSSVILVVCGGLKYAWNWNPYVTLILQVIVCKSFIIICLNASSKTQLNVAKILTFVYAAIMTGVVIGTALKISLDVHDDTRSEANFISKSIKISTTTAYLSTVVGIFVLTAILHLKECIYLLHGIWYLLCLPAGYLLLMIYSICNITDRSWGTRQENRDSDFSSVYQFWCPQIAKRFKSLCCNIPPEAVTSQEQQQDESETTTEQALVGDVGRADSIRSLPKVIGASRISHTGSTVIKVSDWLPDNMGKYTDLFIREGYENTMFISSMTDKDLRKIGITADIDRVALLSLIQKLPPFGIPFSVPTNLPKWLEEIGLKEYSRLFKNDPFDTKDVIERLKSYGKDKIKVELKITKRGHIKRLLYAIARMREPSNRELKIEKVREDLKTVRFDEMVNKKEKEFWVRLIKKTLQPQSNAFGSGKVLKEKLCAIRNTWLISFGLSNILWLILIMTLSEKGHLLGVFGSNPVGFMVVLLFGFILIIQFLAMICHRFSTLKHYLARAPYICGSDKNVMWEYDNKSYSEYDTQEGTESIQDHDHDDDVAEHTEDSTDDETTSLIKKDASAKTNFSCTIL